MTPFTESTMKTKLATIERVGSRLALVDEAGVVLSAVEQSPWAGLDLAQYANLLGLEITISKPE